MRANGDDQIIIENALDRPRGRGDAVEVVGHGGRENHRVRRQDGQESGCVPDPDARVQQPVGAS